MADEFDYPEYDSRLGLKASREVVSIDQIKSEALAIYELGLRFFAFLRESDLLSADATPYRRVHDANARKASRKSAAYVPLNT